MIQIMDHSLTEELIQDLMAEVVQTLAVAEAEIDKSADPTDAWSRTANQLRRPGGRPKTTLSVGPAGELGFAADAVTHA